MKYFCILALLVLMLSAQQCKTNQAATKNLTATSATANMLQKTWLHSYEDDSEGLKTYRPNTYNFPPSRGRTGFAFNSGGEFMQYNIAPTDGLEGVTGKWEMTGEKTIRISFPSGKEEGYSLEIVSLTDDLLKVRRK